MLSAYRTRCRSHPPSKWCWLSLTLTDSFIRCAVLCRHCLLADPIPRRKTWTRSIPQTPNTLSLCRTGRTPQVFSNNISPGQATVCLHGLAKAKEAQRAVALLMELPRRLARPRDLTWESLQLDPVVGPSWGPYIGPREAPGSGTLPGCNFKLRRNHHNRLTFLECYGLHLRSSPT